MTGLLVSAESVMGVMNSFPAGVMTILNQSACQHGRLVGRNATRDTQYNFFAL